MAASLLAPLVCNAEERTGQLSLLTNAPPECGAPLRLVNEVFDEEARVYVGVLECTRGHRWVDQRAPRDARPHRTVA